MCNAKCAGAVYLLAAVAWFPVVSHAIRQSLSPGSEDHADTMQRSPKAWSWDKAKDQGHHVPSDWLQSQGSALLAVNSSSHESSQVGGLFAAIPIAGTLWASISVNHVATQAAAQAASALVAASKALTVSTGAMATAAGAVGLGGGAFVTATGAAATAATASTVATGAAATAGSALTLGTGAMAAAKTAFMTAVGMGGGAMATASGAAATAAAANGAAAAAAATAAGAASMAGTAIVWGGAGLLGVVANAFYASSVAASVAPAIAAAGKMTAVAGPLMEISSMTGISLSSVATISTIGSLAGPILGGTAILIACWPTADKTVALTQIEDDLSALVAGRVFTFQRQRLEKRLKRYVREFGRCIRSFARQNGLAASHEAHASLLELHEDVMGHGASEDFLLNFEHNYGAEHADSLLQKEEDFRSPPCMANLNLIMSLERDEWMDLSAGQPLDALFVPFVTLHHQVQNFLSRYPAVGGTEYFQVQTQKETAAEYALFMMDRIRQEWRDEVCRTVFVRKIWDRAPLVGKNHLQMMVLQPVKQPNALKQCRQTMFGAAAASDCMASGEFCNWCGGHDVGACCEQADVENPDSPCFGFDYPQDEPKAICLHKACQQHNSMYEWTTDNAIYPLMTPNQIEQIKETNEWVDASEDPIIVQDWIQCQQMCQNADGCMAWTFWPKRKCLSLTPCAESDYAEHNHWPTGVQENECRLSGAGAGLVSGKEPSVRRFKMDGAISGPKQCRKAAEHLPAEGEEFTLTKKLVRLETAYNFMEKSPAYTNTRDWEKLKSQVEDELGEWVKVSYHQSFPKVLQEYNLLFSRYAHTIDQLLKSTGCIDQELWEKGDSENELHEVSHDMLESWGSCSEPPPLDPDDESKPTVEKTWQPDLSKAEQMQKKVGLEGAELRRELRQLLPGFPLPLWLERRLASSECLREKFGVRGDFAASVEEAEQLMADSIAELAHTTPTA